MAILSNFSISAVTSQQHDPREPSRSGESTTLNDHTPASHWRHSPGIGISLSGRHADLSISTGVPSPLSGFVAGVSAPLSRYRLPTILAGKGILAFVPPPSGDSAIPSSRTWTRTLLSLSCSFVLAVATWLLLSRRRPRLPSGPGASPYGPGRAA